MQILVEMFSHFPMRIKNFPTRIKKIRFILSLTMALLMLTKGIIILFYFNRQSESELRIVAEYQISKIQQNLTNHLNLFLSGISDAIKIASKQNDGNFKNSNNIRNNATALMSTISQIKKLTFAFSDGNYTTVEKQKFGEATFKLSSYFTDGKILTEFLNKNGSLIAINYEFSNVFNNQPRPYEKEWYKINHEIKKEYWSKIYLMNAKEPLCITFSNPILDEKRKFLGAIAGEVELDSLNFHLKNQSIPPIKTVLLLKDSGEIIAHPWNNETKNIHKTELSKLFKHYSKKNQKKNKYYKQDKGREIVYFTPIKHPKLKDWHICIVIRIDNLIKKLKNKQMKIFWLVIISTLVSYFIGMIIAKKIADSIETVVNELRQIKDFSFATTSIRSNTQFSEIKEMLNLLNAVKVTLDSFRKFVPTTLVQQLIETGQTAKTEGKKQELTVLFSDIRGFSSVVEQMEDTDILFKHMSEYFEEMTKIIKKHGGTIDKYIGDGIMAFWGAPIVNNDHAYLACAAALECSERLKILNAEWEIRKLPVMITRFGISTGEMLVGNMGSSDRLQYTVLGDNVNIAARLEPLNKYYGTQILINESTFKAIEGRIIARPVDKVIVHGKTEVLMIYEPLSLYCSQDNLISISIFAKKMIETQDAFDAYISGDFQTAKFLYLKLLSEDSSDLLSEIFVKKCEDFINQKIEWIGYSKYEKNC